MTTQLWVECGSSHVGARLDDPTSSGCDLLPPLPVLRVVHILRPALEIDVGSETEQSQCAHFFDEWVLTLCKARAHVWFAGALSESVTDATCYRSLLSPELAKTLRSEIIKS